MIEDFRKLYNGLESLKTEIRKLKGDLNKIATGGALLPNIVPGQANIPSPIEGAIIYGTNTPSWGRRAVGPDGDVLTVVAGSPDWAAPTSGNIEDSPTAETDTSLVLSPDGAGGVEFRAEAAGVPTFSGARVYRNTTQSISNNTTTPLQFNAEDYDVGGYHDNATNNTRLTAPTTGYYRVSANIEWGSSSASIRNIWVTRASDGMIPAAVKVDVDSSTDHQMNISATLYLASGDYVEINVIHAIGSALNVGTASSPSVNQFACSASIELIGV